MASYDYKIIIEPLSKEDGGGYIATVPDLPGCMSDGESVLEAAANVQDALGCWLEAAHDMGRSTLVASSEYHRMTP
ncbi:type II toxin-antitoxin system HicB family antitoxin [Rhizobium sp. B230/85]|uniref:type II toxin-antitoxin system HicB family antitoxin n=1 Tax=unclassified Rhizobium TaxID=2613769 RepID=UPI001ADAC2CC|nr:MULTISPECIES: type II toxin-antitoxin system HicB family antitoxin [unclassified Rhizobium]MBO9135138.1 type II toxin-antitoxin system HicB family antitoxin [Rhizobium sp. B209b/85]QXZ97955.1 type II toxin-antitoxin system HicB family antitoxin [Rhizobium sp. B230/85]